MNTTIKTIAFILLFGMISSSFTSCASKRKMKDLGIQLDESQAKARANSTALADCKKNREKIAAELAAEKAATASNKQFNDQIVNDLRAQIEDLKSQRTQQYNQVGDLTVLSKSANENMGQTIKQLEQKDRYITYLMNTKTKADSLNLALAVNLKRVLKKGIDDEDIEVKVDKTVVFINLSDKMLYQSGSYKLTSRADEVLAKIAMIIEANPELDVMVEGYTDNVPISSACMEDNWDLSVRRSSEVVKTLQKKYGVNPDKLIAAGRGEYNKLESNDTAEGRAINRRTRIILMPKLNQFYDLLKPTVISAQ